MIVECPNCFLEQPLDQYCAGCGKELDKLLVEKKKKTSARIKKTNYIIGLLTISFLTASYFYYSNLNKQGLLLSDIESTTDTSIKVELPKTKIKGESQKVHTAKSYRAYSVESKKKKPVKKAKAPAAATKETETEATKDKKVDTIYFISTENCTNAFSIGDLTKDQKTELLSCAKIHLQTKTNKSEEILEDGTSFSTQVSVDSQEYLIELSFNLTTDMYIEEYKQTLPLDIDEKSIATLWSNTGHEIESTEAPDDEMLSSYATSALFNFSYGSGEPPKLYFLATYK